jgi:hypothetical protein
MTMKIIENRKINEINSLREFAAEKRYRRKYKKERLSQISLGVQLLFVTGNPSLYSTVPVEIYTQETVERTLRFVLPHSVPQIRGNQSAFEAMLKAISGGRRVDILDVVPYEGDADASLNRGDGGEGTDPRGL